MQKKLCFILLLIVFAGIIFRAMDVSTRSLEYDEIWTLQHYFKYSFSEIFTKLETPNNHPLYTLCTQKMCTVFSAEVWALRMTALISGIALLAAALWAAKGYLYSKYAKIVLIATAAFSPYLVHYSNTARGYSMQAFFVFAMVLCMFSYAKKPSIWKACGVFVTAASALFTIYSGLIFVCAASGAYMLSFFKWKEWKTELKKNIFLFASGADFAIAAALWLGLNWSKITQAQQFGTKIVSVMQFLQSIGHLIYDLQLIVPLAIIIIAFVLRPKDKYLRFGSAFAVLTFISILATKCGPARVYMPMIAVVLFAAARGIEVIGAGFCKVKHLKFALMVIGCLPCIFIETELNRILPPDWNYFARQIEKNTPESCYLVYPAGDTYPILHNYSDCALKIAQRSAGNLDMAAFISPLLQQIECSSEKNKSVAVDLPEPLQKIGLTNNYVLNFYSLAELDRGNLKNGSPLIAVFSFMPKNSYLYLRRVLFENEECYILNLFFNRDYMQDGSSTVLRSVTLFIPSAKCDYKFYQNLTRSGGGKLKFYILKSSGN